MTRAYLIIDESGAKGYSSNTEKIQGEFGVMVGYLVPFIADILANSTHFYLNKAVKENINIELNSKEAIKEHPLSNLVYGCTQHSTEYTMDFMDIMYHR